MDVNRWPQLHLHTRDTVVYAVDVDARNWSQGASLCISAGWAGGKGTVHIGRRYVRHRYSRYPPPLYKLRPCPSYSRRRDRINLGPNFNSVPNVVQLHKAWVW